VANGDGGDNEKAGGSGVACVTTAVGSSKRQARPPTDHFERLLEEACPNHTSVPHQAQAMELQHDEEFYGLRASPEA
jgi:hypothetical protein